MIENKRCVLVVDDETKMVRAIRDFLTAHKFCVLEAFDGESALDVYYANNAVIDLVLLDVMMPKKDGFEVLEELRENSSLVPVIMLTARGEEYDQVKGFSSGADDYITKPFSPSLLLARVEAMLKRMGKGVEDEMKKGNLRINSVMRTAQCGEKELELTKREFDLLLFFMTNTSLIFSREQLLNSVWGYDFDGELRTVDTHVKQLRTKLGEDSTCIKTIHRVGYKFEV